MTTKDILSGGVAVITGAAGGLGEGLARVAGGLGMKLVLADIAARMKENEKAFLDGIESLDEALERLEDIEAILGTVSTVLKIVGRVVTLL